MAPHDPRRPGVLALAASAGFVLAGCGVLLPGPEDAGGRSGEFTGCIVSDAERPRDGSFDRGAHDGLEAAEKDLGIRTREAEARTEADVEPYLNEMVQAGCDLTVSVGFPLADTTRKVAEAHPDRHFAAVDGNSIEAGDVEPIVYDTAQAAFLAGYLAAGTSESGKVATYGGMDLPTVRVFMDGFSDGVDHYNERKDADVEVLGWDKGAQDGTFLNSSQDSAQARAVTRNLIDDGADAVLPVAGAAARGAVDAVREADEGGKDVRLIWPDTDGYETLDRGQEYLLTSVLKDIATPVQDVMTRAADGRFGSTRYVGTLANGGVGLAGYHDREEEVSRDLDGEVRQLERDIIDGSLEVRSENAPRP